MALPHTGVYECPTVIVKYQIQKQQRKSTHGMQENTVLSQSMCIGHILHKIESKEKGRGPPPCFYFPIAQESPRSLPIQNQHYFSLSGFEPASREKFSNPLGPE